MFCRFVEKNISAYLDGETGRLTTRLIERHLKFCSSCRAKYAAIKVIGGLVRLKKESFSLSPEFMTNLRVKINTHKVLSEEKKTIPILKLSFSALGLLVVIAGGLLFLPRAGVKETNEYGTVAFQTRAEIIYTDNGVEMATFDNQTGR